MGDRTWVGITIRKSDFTKHEKFFRSDEVGAESCDTETSPYTVQISDSSVNYAEWDELETFLRKHEIEYDKTWADGGNYEAGSSYYRMIEGQYRSYEIYKTQESLLEYMEEFLAEYEADPKKAIESLKETIKQLNPWKPRDLNEPNSLRFIKDDYPNPEPGESQA